MARFVAILAISSCSSIKQTKIDSAEVAIGRGHPESAYLALEDARDLEPHGGALDQRIDVLEKRAREEFLSHVAPRGTATLTVRFQSQTSDWISLQKVRFFLDLHPLPTDPARYNPGTLVTAVPPTTVAGGGHELDVVAVYRSYSSSGEVRVTSRSSQFLVLEPGTSTTAEVRFTDFAPPPVYRFLHSKLTLETK